MREVVQVGLPADAVGRVAGYYDSGAIYAPTSCVRVRCRKVRITNNKFTGPEPNAQATSSDGVAIDGAGGVLCKGSIYSRLSGGIYVYDPYGGHQFYDETFDAITNVGIRIEGDAEDSPTRIQNCKCNFHSGIGFEGVPKAWIWTTGSTPVKVVGCDLTKSGNDYSIKADADGEELIGDDEGTLALGNTCFGYGADDDGTTGAAIGRSEGNFTDSV